MNKPKRSKEIIRSVTPLTEASFYILSALSTPMHGYGVMQLVSEMTHNRVELGPGTLYGALTNLQALGLIETVASDGSDRRKLYRQTPMGRSVVEKEIDRLEEVTRHGRLLLGL